jgi:hypothetical protein
MGNPVIFKPAKHEFYYSPLLEALEVVFQKE